MSGRPDRAPDLVELLDHLAGLAKPDDAKTEDLPRVQLAVRGGSGYVGQLFAAESGRVLIGNEGSLTALASSEIISVTIDQSDAGALFGLPESGSSTSVSNLELKRRVRKIEEARDLSIEFPWGDVPEADVAKGDVVGLVDSLSGALDAISGDDLGAEALGKISSITFAVGDKTLVDRSGKKIEIGIRVRDDRVLGPTDLLEQLESAL